MTIKVGNTVKYIVPASEYFDQEFYVHFISDAKTPVYTLTKEINSFSVKIVAILREIELIERGDIFALDELVEVSDNEDFSYSEFGYFLFDIRNSAKWNGSNVPLPVYSLIEGKVASRKFVRKVKVTITIDGKEYYIKDPQCELLEELKKHPVKPAP